MTREYFQNRNTATRQEMQAFYKSLMQKFKKWESKHPGNKGCPDKYVAKYMHIESKKYGFDLPDTVQPRFDFFSKEQLDTILNIIDYLPNCNVLKNLYQRGGPITGEKLSKTPEEETLAEEEGITTDEEGDPKNILIRKISILKEHYYRVNKKCFREFEVNHDRYSKFLKGYRTYLEHGFKNSLKNIPNTSSEDNMTYKELLVYHRLLKKLPNCIKLINEGSRLQQTHMRTNKNLKDAYLRNIKKHKEQEKVRQKQRIASQRRIAKKTLSPPFGSTSYHKPKIPSVSLLGGKRLQNTKDIEKVVQQNQGNIQKNPFGKREVNPSPAPYLSYITDIGKYLQNISVSLKNIEKKATKMEVKSPKKTIENMKNTANDKDIVDKIKSDQENNTSNISGKNSREKLYQRSNVKNYKIMSHNQQDKLLSQSNKKEVGYKNITQFDHLEPSKKVFSAYGWSYMPPQSWSVPQRRPPVCIKDKTDNTKIMPTLDRGVPVDALNWTQVGSILPKFEYKEHYNPDYYHPGWKAQDKANYPKFSGGKNFSNNYYNYNRGEKTD